MSSVLEAKVTISYMIAILNERVKLFLKFGRIELTEIDSDRISALRQIYQNLDKLDEGQPIDRSVLEEVRSIFLPQQ
jgi:hypothetical protein